MRGFLIYRLSAGRQVYRFTFDIMLLVIYLLRRVFFRRIFLRKERIQPVSPAQD